MIPATAPDKNLRPTHSSQASTTQAISLGGALNRHADAVKEAVVRQDEVFRD